MSSIRRMQPLIIRDIRGRKLDGRTLASFTSSYFFSTSSIPSSDKNHQTNNSLKSESQCNSSLQSCGVSALSEHPSHFVDVTPLATMIRQRVQTYANSLTRRLPPQSSPAQRCNEFQKLKLVGILANVGKYHPDSELYSQRIEKTCQEDGIDYELWRCSAKSPEDVQETIQRANEDEAVNGILVFYPIFTDKGPYHNQLNGVYYKTQDDHLRHIVAPWKDVEGLQGTEWYHNPRRKKRTTTHLNGKQNDDKKVMVYPCTARSVEAILEQYHSSNWEDQTVSIVNRSEILGRPLAAMLAAKGATVYSIDERSILKFWPYGTRLQRIFSTLETCLTESNIIVTGVPQEDFEIPTEAIPRNTTVVNVSEFTNVDETTIAQRIDITYIPQVGKVTVAILEENLVQLHQQMTALNQ